MFEEKRRQDQIEASLAQPILDFDVFTPTRDTENAMARYPADWPELYRRQAAKVETQVRKKLTESRDAANPDVFEGKRFTGEYLHGDVLCKWTLTKVKCHFRIAGPDKAFGTRDDYTVEF